jgi:hypothetical protein
MSDRDQRIRLSAFNVLDQQTQLHGETPAQRAGHRVRVRRHSGAAPRSEGIFKPAILEVPLSITTVPPVEGKRRPYDDEMAKWLRTA